MLLINESIDNIVNGETQVSFKDNVEKSSKKFFKLSYNQLICKFVLIKTSYILKI